MRKNISGILSAIGCISGVITDIIGAMFIKMYIKNLENSISFFNKLVDDSRLLYIQLHSEFLMNKLGILRYQK